MKIGILNTELEKDAIEIIASHPDVDSVYSLDSVVSISSDNLNKVIEDLEIDYNLHLVVNGDDFLLATSINEEDSLAAKVANAGANAADADSSGVFSRISDVREKRDLANKKRTEKAPSDMEDEAKERASEVSDGGHKAKRNELMDLEFRKKELEGTMSDSEEERIRDNPEFPDDDDEFVSIKIPKKSVE